MSYLDDMRRKAEEALRDDAGMPELWIDERYGELWGTSTSKDGEKVNDLIAEFNHDAVQNVILTMRSREPALARAVLALVKVVYWAEIVDADEAFCVESQRELRAALAALSSAPTSESREKVEEQDG